MIRVSQIILFKNISKFLWVIKKVNALIFIKENEDSIGDIQWQIDYRTVTLFSGLHG